MVSQKIVIKNEKGLHMRPATQMCSEAAKYEAIITVTVGSKTVNAKSLLNVLGAKIRCGDEIEIVCEGIDEKEALKKMTQIMEEGLGEKVN